MSAPRRCAGPVADKPFLKYKIFHVSKRLGYFVKDTLELAFFISSRWATFVFMPFYQISLSIMSELNLWRGAMLISSLCLRYFLQVFAVETRISRKNHRCARHFVSSRLELEILDIKCSYYWINHKKRYLLQYLCIFYTVDILKNGEFWQITQLNCAMLIFKPMLRVWDLFDEKVRNLKISKL